MTPAELKEKIMDLRCDKCEGFGSLAYIDPCSTCDGTGFNLDETWKEIFEDM